jgi:hypothetical protein
LIFRVGSTSALSFFSLVRIIYSEFLKDQWGKVSQLVGANATPQFALPTFASDGKGYSEDTQELLKIMSFLKAREPEVSYSQRILDWQMTR